MGEAVTGLVPGAHVIGANIGGGAFAEYMVLAAAAAVPVPVGWADEQALGLVVNWPTALAALRPLAVYRRRDRAITPRRVRPARPR